MTLADRTILLVEDDPDDEKLTLRAFKQSNIANPVAVARDGVEALDYLFARGPHSGRAGKPGPTLVVLDLKLPKLDGLGVLKAIRADERTKLIPVVIMTSSKEEEDVLNGYANGANIYIRKPVDFTQLQETTKVLGIYWLMINQPPPERAAK